MRDSYRLAASVKDELNCDYLSDNLYFTMDPYYFTKLYL